MPFSNEYPLLAQYVSAKGGIAKIASRQTRISPAQDMEKQAGKVLGSVINGAFAMGKRSLGTTLRWPGKVISKVTGGHVNAPVRWGDNLAKEGDDIIARLEANGHKWRANAFKWAPTTLGVAGVTADAYTPETSVFKPITRIPGTIWDWTPFGLALRGAGAGYDRVQYEVGKKYKGIAEQTLREVAQATADQGGRLGHAYGVLTPEGYKEKMLERGLSEINKRWNAELEARGISNYDADTSAAVSAPTLADKYKVQTPDR